MTRAIEIDWLDCPDCGKKDTIVYSEKGNRQRLYDGDKTVCLECGKEGEIETDGENAWVI